MLRISERLRVGLFAACALWGAGCGDDDGAGHGGNAGSGEAAGQGDRAGSGGHAGSSGHAAAAEPDAGPGTADGGTDAAPQTLCAKYGGPAAIASVMKTQVYDAIGADCRVNAFFTALSRDATLRVGDCLAVQAQELFGCPGVVYAGSMASNGLPCRSMTAAHAGLNISAGDFDALIEDVVAGLTEAGVEPDDIALAAPALLGLQPEIVSDDSNAKPSSDVCDADGGT